MCVCVDRPIRLSPELLSQLAYLTALLTLLSRPLGEPIRRDPEKDVNTLLRVHNSIGRQVEVMGHVSIISGGSPCRLLRGLISSSFAVSFVVVKDNFVAAAIVIFSLELCIYQQDTCRTVMCTKRLSQG